MTWLGQRPHGGRGACRRDWKQRLRGSHVDVHDEAGATAVEYGLILGAVGIAFVVAGPTLWRALLSLLDAILDGMVG